MEDGNLGVSSLVPYILKGQLHDNSSPDPFFGSNGLDYFWQKEDLISFLSVIHNLEAFSICSYDVRSELGVKQLDLPSTNVFFWCPAGFICSPSTAECLKIDEYSYHQGYQFFDFFQYLYLLCITVASIFIVKFLYSLLHYLTSSNEAVLFHRPRRRNTPVDRLLYWISFQFFKMKVRWKGLRIPIQQLQIEDLIAVLRKMEPRPTVRFMMTCKAANEFCTKYKSRITVPEEDLEFKYNFRILT